MTYKCPLCLKELNQKEKLVRYCFTCESFEEINAGPENIRAKLKCVKATCLRKESIVEGMFFAHAECEKHNPFWDGTELKVPDIITIDGNSIEVSIDNHKRKFKHWQISLLKKTVGLRRKEMWFPGILLRATKEARKNGGRIGQIVGLAGVKGAGKTILALQTLDHEGYFEPSPGKKIEIIDYVYSQPKSGESVQPIFELIYLRSQMHGNEQFPKPSPTVRNSVNLYAVFFAPTEKALHGETKKTGKNSGADQTASAPVPPTGQIKEVGASWWEKVKKGWDLAFGADFGHGNSSKPYMFTLSLYDLAGEEFANETDLIRDLSQKVDKIALVIDSTDFCQPCARPDIINRNLADNLDGLRYLKNELNKSFCVVLTKADLFLDHLWQAAPENFQEVTEVSFKDDFYGGNQKKIKELLKKQRAAIADLDLPFKLNLLQMMDELLSLDEKTPIFFVATENLPSDVSPTTPAANDSKQTVSGRTPMVTKQPVSIGIDTFVAWCLKIEKDDFIHLSN